MTTENKKPFTPRSQSLSRRDFLKMAASVTTVASAAAVSTLLTGCGASEAPATPTSTQTPTSAPTETPTARPTRRPTRTLVPSPTTPPLRKPDVIKMYPETKSKVVHTRHAGVWSGDTLSPEAIHTMLDASITNLTGLNDATAAWKALFSPDERIAIKINVFRNSLIWTHVPLVTAVTDSLQAADIPAENIVVFDYYTSELQEAGFAINKDGAGVRCYGTDQDYTQGWRIGGTQVNLSDILLSSDALINIPILKSHMIAGMSFALKNHYGTIRNPAALHRMRPCLPELNALAEIKDRTRLVIGDILNACLRYNNSFPYWESDFTGDSILMSFDPLAHDTVGFDIFEQYLSDDGGNPQAAINMAQPWFEHSAELALGASTMDDITLEEINL